MPTYDYECRACGERFELFQSIAAAPKRKCPKCGKPKLARLIGTGAAILFRGAGFYATDYRRPGPKEKAESHEVSAKAEGSKEKTPEKDSQQEG